MTTPHITVYRKDSDSRQDSQSEEYAEQKDEDKALQDTEEVSHADKLCLGGKDAERMRKRVTCRVQVVLQVCGAK